MSAEISPTGRRSISGKYTRNNAAVGGAYREEEIQAAGVLSERKAKISAAKSSDIKDRAQPGARVNDSGQFFLQCSGLGSWLEKLVLSMSLWATQQMQELYFRKERKNFLLPNEVRH